MMSQGALREGDVMADHYQPQGGRALAALFAVKLAGAN